MGLLKYIYFLLLVLMFNPCFSQNINIGASAGVNASQVSGDGYGGFNKAGLIVGLYSDFDISPTFNMQFEINYSQKGSRRNPNTSEGDTEFFLMRMDYIEVPVLLRVQKDRFTYEAGFYYGQLVNSYLEDENGPFEIPPQWNQFKENDFGGLIGINFNFTENIIMNWRFSNSVVPFRKYNSGESFRFDSGMFHHYLSFTLRYEFIGNGS